MFKLKSQQTEAERWVQCLIVGLFYWLCLWQSMGVNVFAMIHYIFEHFIESLNEYDVICNCCLKRAKNMECQ